MATVYPIDYYDVHTIKGSTVEPLYCGHDINFNVSSLERCQSLICSQLLGPQKTVLISLFQRCLLREVPLSNNCLVPVSSIDME